MKLLTFYCITCVCIVVILHQALSYQYEIIWPTSCAHHLHCPHTQCCLGHDDFLSFSYGDDRPGFCHDYKREGQECQFVELFECDCFPGLRCLPEDGSPETYDNLDMRRVCTNTSAPYRRPASEARCRQDADCPSPDECCHGYREGNTASLFDIMGYHGDGHEGRCELFLREGENCATPLWCGCGSGLECGLPTTTDSPGQELHSYRDKVCLNVTL